MSKVLGKWYFSLILIPIIINIITAKITLSNFFDNWELTLIGILIVTILILLYELIKAKKVTKTLQEKPKDRDKKIVSELIKAIDIDDFEKSIYQQDSWYGYSQTAIDKSIEFTQKAHSISYKTSDKDLNKLIEKLSDSIYSFNQYAGVKLYSEGKFYKPAKESEYNLKVIDEARPIMNEMTDKAYEDLQKLLEYLRNRDYLE